MKYEQHKSTITLLLLFISLGLYSQNIVINENDRISEMMSIYKRSNQQEKQVQAWRIQIITTDDRRKMENARTEFNQLYPEIDTDWKHVSPWYHLKAGAYQTKLELQGFLIQIKKDFPGAIPIMDRVQKEQLLSP